MLKKISKIILAIFFFLFLIFFVLYLIFNEKKPIVIEGSEAQADALAQQMHEALNKAAWDTTAYVQWTFREKNDYIWDRSRKFVDIQIKNTRVLMDLDDWNRTRAFEGGEVLDGKRKDIVINNAWKNFCNDAFWLEAPYKVFDKDTERHLVDSKYGENAFLLTYNSGGVTPGDSYLWVLDDQGMPLYYKMWVKILPIGGIKATWENWQELPEGAKIAADHKIKSLNIPITNLKTGKHHEDLNLKEDPFDGF